MVELSAVGIRGPGRSALSWPPRRLGSCTKARSRTSSTNSGGCPGVGPKSAQRIAFHLLQADEIDVQRLADALAARSRQKVRFCATCGNVAEAEQCRICLDPRRDPHVICVVEEPKDVVADRAHPRVPRPLPRARRRDQPDRGHRPGRPADRPVVHAPRPTARVTRSSSPPTPTSRVRRPRPTWPGSSPPWSCASRGWPPACRSAATWSTPTR